MKILLLGGSGCLGTELKSIDSNIITPTRSEVDINDVEVLKKYIRAVNPDIIINAAAETDNRKVEKLPIQAIQTNVIGTANLAIICRELNIRLVYISTDYIYKGDRGNYKETDEILPFNLYSWLKLGGECSTKAVKNHLIIRTSFGKNEFEYSESFVDKWSSKDYVNIIAPLIYQAAISPLTGVLNLGTERKTLFSHAVERNKNVKGVKLADTNYFTPYDTSLNLQKWQNYTQSKSIANSHSKCRFCESENLEKYLDLGLMPLANNLEFTAPLAKEKERFPLQVLLCNDCSASQLSVVIDPEKMFSYYTYRSSINAGYVKHCRQMAKELKQKYNLNESSFHIDIAGNDGALLKEFKEEIGLKVLNIDPAKNLCAIAEAQGIESLPEFLSLDVASIIFEKHGGADLVTATNVFAHVDNVKEFLLSCSEITKNEGVIVLEFPYLIDFIENNEFDTVYFEHLSYVNIKPLNLLCKVIGLRIIEVEKQNIHGGTVRVHITDDDSPHEETDSVKEFILNEKDSGFDIIGNYNAWAKDVQKTIDDFALNILDLKKQGFKIAAFAASAKGNTLLNSAGINTDIIDYIADETPEKIGKFSPGTGIPIVNKNELVSNPPDYLIILSWNFKEEIIEKVSKIYKGKYIIPIPTFQIIEA